MCKYPFSRVLYLSFFSEVVIQILIDDFCGQTTDVEADRLPQRRPAAPQRYKLSSQKAGACMEAAVRWEKILRTSIFGGVGHDQKGFDYDFDPLDLPIDSCFDCEQVKRCRYAAAHRLATQTLTYRETLSFLQLFSLWEVDCTC